MLENRSEPRRLLDVSAISSRGEMPGYVVDVLNFALTLEHLEAEFYTRGVNASGLLSGAMQTAAAQIMKHEVAHVRVLQSLLGERAIQKPAFDFTAGGTFPGAFSDARTFMALAQAFEDTGVRAYKGQAAHIMTHRTLLTQALQIHSVEARHAAHIRRLRGQNGWITRDDRGDLPEATQKVYAGDNARFQFILAQPSSHKDDLTQAFDEPLNMGQVLEIVKPFIGGGA